MNGLIGIAGVLAILLVAGTAIGLADRRRFDARWLLVAALLVLVNDALLTNGYGTIPRVLGGAWNWQGKLLALAATLGIAALPAFGWRRSGLTLAQARGSLVPCLAVAAVYALFFAGVAVAFPDDPANGETVAFQLTLPGLEEEPFYRGILLLALDRAFTGRVRWLGVDWGWGALLSSMLFGLAHAFSYGRGGFALDPLVMALTGLPALIAVWLRLRSGSLVWPVSAMTSGSSAKPPRP